MLTAALIIAAALVLGGRDLWAKVAPMLAAVPRPELSWRQVVAAMLLIGAVAAFNLGSPVTPAPGPEPAPGPLELRGLFSGPTGAEDAVLVSALTGELADEIAWDGCGAGACRSASGSRRPGTRSPGTSRRLSARPADRSTPRPGRRG